MPTSPIVNRLPVEPIARRQPDGRIIRVIRHNRHHITTPELAFRPQSWRADMSVNSIVSSFGHPEYMVIDSRIEVLLDNTDILPEISARDVHNLKVMQALLPLIVEPVREKITASWPASHLLPIFGNWPTFSDLQARFRQRNGRQEAYDAIGFLHGVSASLDLMEGRLGSGSLVFVGMDRGDQ